MSLPLLVTARVALLLTFALAGTTKLLDPRTTRGVLVDFAMPERAAPAASIVLPWLELFVCALLASAWGIFEGAALGLALLGGFTLVVAVTLRGGRRPECQCFGHLTKGPIGGRTIARNLALSLAPLMILVLGKQRREPSLVGWLPSSGGLALVLASALVVALVLLAGSAWRQSGLGWRLARWRLARAACDQSGSGLPKLVALDGGTRRLEDLLASRTILVFVNPYCGPCNALLPELAARQRERRTEIVVIATGSTEANAAKASEHELRSLFVDTKGRVARLYKARVTPSALAVEGDGLPQSALVEGASAIRSLLDEYRNPEITGSRARLMRMFGRAAARRTVSPLTRPQRALALPLAAGLAGRPLSRAAALRMFLQTAVLCAFGGMAASCGSGGNNTTSSVPTTEAEDEADCHGFMSSCADRTADNTAGENCTDLIARIRRTSDTESPLRCPASGYTPNKDVVGCTDCCFWVHSHVSALRKTSGDCVEADVGFIASYRCCPTTSRWTWDPVPPPCDQEGCRRALQDWYAAIEKHEQFHRDFASLLVDDFNGNIPGPVRIFPQQHKATIPACRSDSGQTAGEVLSEKITTRALDLSALLTAKWQREPTPKELPEPPCAECGGDLNSDAANCGSCGHSCGEGDCVGGNCVCKVDTVPCASGSNVPCCPTYDECYWLPNGKFNGCCPGAKCRWISYDANHNPIQHYDCCEGNLACGPKGCQ